ncbi:hypothetical protein WN944_022831 [Citrus x changshan-huyou]|uniref:Uncharacterized protein n=1 Tax=Citrus x changshan-huyou TaxID=2935761 RepID=A0AAP0N3X4_9ROSI
MKECYPRSGATSNFAAFVPIRKLVASPVYEYMIKAHLVTFPLEYRQQEAYPAGSLLQGVMYIAWSDGWSTKLQRSRLYMFIEYSSFGNQYRPVQGWDLCLFHPLVSLVFPTSCCRTPTVLGSPTMLIIIQLVVVSFLYTINMLMIPVVAPFDVMK